jgi:hypothetical protein
MCEGSVIRGFDSRWCLQGFTDVLYVVAHGFCRANSITVCDSFCDTP